MKKIDSQALDSLVRALGLSGPGSPITELTDGIVDQVIDVKDIIRRSRTQAQTAGIYTGMLRNAHTGATSLTATLAPFNATTTARAPYPAPMPADFDVWLLTAAVTQLSGGGTLSGALRVNCTARIMGLTTTGAAVASVQNVAFWNTVVVEATTFGTKSGTTTPLQNIGMRLPRDPLTQIVFGSTSSATATFDCFITLGVFPVGLGQDVIV